MKYGLNIYYGRWYLTLVVNGHIFSVFKGTNTGRWSATYTQNIWRKTREGIPA